MSSETDSHRDRFAVLLTILNPLDGTLRHYTSSLETILTGHGVTCAVVTTREPSASHNGPLKWVLTYLRLLLRCRRRPAGPLLILWPVLGFWDLLLARCLAGGQVWVVLHDPRPLVRSIGYGPLARWAGRRSWVETRLIVHSESAATSLREMGGPEPLAVLPLPMRHPMKARDAPSVPIIRVVGQFKSDRDCAALEELARAGPRTWRYEILGRGWPKVPGWHVADVFLTESEFDDAIRSSSVVLIPYKRFFQSAVAVQTLELGTPVVGPRRSGLSDLVGKESAWLVGERREWLEAVRAALGANSGQIEDVATGAFKRGSDGWAVWIDEVMTAE